MYQFKDNPVSYAVFKNNMYTVHISKINKPFACAEYLNNTKRESESAFVHMIPVEQNLKTY